MEVERRSLGLGPKRLKSLLSCDLEGRGFRVFGVLGFRVLGFGGFRVYGFKGLGFRVLVLRAYRAYGV